MTLLLKLYVGAVGVLVAARVNAVTVAVSEAVYGIPETGGLFGPERRKRKIARCSGPGYRGRHMKSCGKVNGRAR